LPWAPAKVRQKARPWLPVAMSLSELLIDWPAVFAECPARRIGLPGYAFQRRRYWLDSGSTRHAAPVETAGDTLSARERVYAPRGKMGRLWGQARRVLIGAPLALGRGGGVAAGTLGAGAALAAAALALLLAEPRLTRSARSPRPAPPTPVTPRADADLGGG